MRTFGFVQNSIIIVQKIGVGVQVSGQHMGEQGDVRKLSVELRRCAAPFRRKRRDQLGNGEENGVWRRSPDLGFRFDELPDAFFVIELEQQLLILLVASDDAQHSVGVGALLLLQDERAVCRAQ